MPCPQFWQSILTKPYIDYRRQAGDGLGISLSDPYIGYTGPYITYDKPYNAYDMPYIGYRPAYITYKTRSKSPQWRRQFWQATCATL